MVQYEGDGWRHISPEYAEDPLSGEGAYLRGGRLNPRRAFPVLYLCSSAACASAEVQRLAVRNNLDVRMLFPRWLFRYRVALDHVLDLTDKNTAASVGVNMEDLLDHDWLYGQRVGSWARREGYQAVIVPSVTGVDEILAVFDVGMGGVSVTSRFWLRDLEDTVEAV